MFPTAAASLSSQTVKNNLNTPSAFWHQLSTTDSICPSIYCIHGAEEEEGRNTMDATDWSDLVLPPPHTVHLGLSEPSKGNSSIEILFRIQILC